MLGVHAGLALVALVLLAACGGNPAMRAVQYRGGHAPSPPRRRSRRGPTPARGSLRSRVVALVALVALVLLAACGGNPAMRAQGARFSDVPDPEPERFEGKRPVVVLIGKATYYSDSLAGNRTANGDVYDPARLTAASRDLPFGSVVRVVRRDTGAHVVVRINDRGPFGDRRRILDLSRAAAKELGMLKRGVVDVRAEVLELGKRKPKKKRRRR